MKNLLLFIVCTTAAINLNAQTQTVNFANYYHDGCYVFNTGLEVMQSQIFTTYKSQFGLGSNDAMDTIEIHYDSTDGGFHSR